MIVSAHSTTPHFKETYSNLLALTSNTSAREPRLTSFGLHPVVPKVPRSLGWSIVVLSVMVFVCVIPFAGTGEISLLFPTRLDRAICTAWNTGGTRSL